MDDRFFFNSPSESPFQTGLPSTSMNTDYVSDKVSPVKKEPMTFSPFKTSGLSPFKLINQSPSKGSYDEWDKDFIASFEETLFGMDDGMIAQSVLGDILKSPAGKAMLESHNSPLRMKNAPAVRRLKISPSNKNTSSSFQCLSQSNESMVESGVNDFVIKEEMTQDDYLYGQTVAHMNSNTLSAIDPNKMSATPIKPGLAHSENIPKRKLAMKVPEQTQPFQAYVIQDNALSGIQHVRNEWPSKEKLKYARLQFQKVLNMAVEREIEILQEQRKQKTGTQTRKAEKENRKQTNNHTKIKAVKAGKGKVSKSKGNGKKSRHDKYPQIKMALSKPASKKGSGSKPYQISKKLFKSSLNNEDLGWYPDDDQEDNDEESWTGPVPFKTGGNHSYLEEEENWSEDEGLHGYRFETQSGRQVSWKKRRIY